MKYLTKEWYNLRSGSYTHDYMCVSKAAETFSEVYFHNLYKCKLNQFLRLHKEMSLLTADDIFPPGRWDSLSIVNMANIYDQLPVAIKDKYGFHDSKVILCDRLGTNVIIELEHYRGSSNICKVIYHNAEIIEEENIVGSWWIYGEIYLQNELYEFHTLLQDEFGELRYFTLRASTVEIIHDF